MGGPEARVNIKCSKSRPQGSEISMAQAKKQEAWKLIERGRVLDSAGGGSW